MRMEVFLQKADVGGVGVINRTDDVRRFIQSWYHIKVSQVVTDRILINHMPDYIICNKFPVWMLFTVQQDSVPIDP